MRVYLNGRYMDADQATVPVTDRGFLFGDGVYDVVRSAGSELVEVERHLRRITRGLHELHIALTGDRIAELQDISRTLLRDNHVTGDAIVYWQVTRGAAPRTHHFPPSGTAPTVFVTTSPIPLPHALRRRGSSVITVPDVRWSRCDIKSVNLLPNVLAKQQAVDAEADEAIFVRDGVIMEAASSTVFVVLDGELRTHPLTTHILPGITREIVVELASELGLPLREFPVLAQDLPRASEMFFTSTVNDIMPIVRVDGRSIGTGRPGPITQQLYAAFAERIGAVVGTH
jgi:D-alanine transaminase